MKREKLKVTPFGVRYAGRLIKLEELQEAATGGRTVAKKAIQRIATERRKHQLRAAGHHGQWTTQGRTLAKAGGLRDALAGVMQPADPEPTGMIRWLCGKCWDGVGEELTIGWFGPRTCEVCGEHTRDIHPTRREEPYDGPRPGIHHGGGGWE